MASGIIVRMRGVGVLLAVVVLGPAAAGSTEAHAARHSGVSIRVAWQGPCAVPGPRCDNHGVPATIRVERARSRQVVRSVHARTGKIRIRLRAGRYRLLAAADGGGETGSALVTVERRRFTSVVVRVHRRAP